MSHRIKKVKYLDEYKLSVQFDDESIKEVDLINTINRAKGMVLQLKDVEYFKKVKCDGITVYWPNGVDLCPDMLYQIGKTINRTKKQQKKSLPAASRRKSKSSKAAAK